MPDEGIVKIDKYLFIAGGPPPRDLARFVSSSAYTQICKEAQAANLSAQNWACCLEFGFCCIGLYLVTCIHGPLANAVFDRTMSKKMNEFNANLFDNKPVIGMRGGGAQLQFVFNTNLLEAIPVVAEAQLASTAANTINPINQTAFMPPTNYGYGGGGDGFPGFPGGSPPHNYNNNMGNNMNYYNNNSNNNNNPVFAGTGTFANPPSTELYKPSSTGVEMNYPGNPGAISMPGSPPGTGYGGVAPSAPIMYENTIINACDASSNSNCNSSIGMGNPVVFSNGGTVASGTGVYMGGGNGVYFGGM